MRWRAIDGIGKTTGCVLVATALMAGLTVPVATQSAARPSQPRTAVQAKAPQKPLVKSKDPEAAAILVNLIARYASDVKDKTDLDKNVQKALSADPGSRQVARRMIANLQRASVAKRQAVLGRWADTAATAKFAPADARRAFERLARYRPVVASGEEPAAAPPGAQLKHRRFENPNERDDGRPGPGERRPFNQWIPKGGKWIPEREVEQRSPFPGIVPVVEAQDQPNRYQLYYNGMWCRYETDEDHGTDSDEVYAIVTITEGGGTATTLRIPGGNDPRYHWDVDDGEHRPRSGTIRRIWGGSRGRTARDLTLAVWAYEQDSGDPEERRQAIDLTWKAAMAICGATIETGPIPCVLSILGAALVEGLIAILTGGEDDPVGDVITSNITADQMSRWVDSGLRTWRRGDLPSHFRTIHIGSRNSEGADYRLYFAFHIPLDAY